MIQNRLSMAFVRKEAHHEKTEVRAACSGTHVSPRPKQSRTGGYKFSEASEQDSISEC